MSPQGRVAVRHRTTCALASSPRRVTRPTSRELLTAAARTDRWPETRGLAARVDGSRPARRSINGTRRRIRLRASARTPQRQQPTTSAVVSTTITTSDSVSVTSSTRKRRVPEVPRPARYRRSSSGVSRPRDLRTATKMAGPWPAWWMVGYVTVPTSTRRACYRLPRYLVPTRRLRLLYSAVIRTGHRQGGEVGDHHEGPMSP
jgi:hypothetical protein